MSLVARFIAVFILSSNSTCLFAKDIYVLIVGQSIASNCNQYKFGPSSSVYQVMVNGDEEIARDPFDWADCDKGSIWIPLGELFIESGVATRVIFMPIGVKGSSIGDWSNPNSIVFKKRLHVTSLVKHKRIRFDYALWLQGSSDVGTSPINYGQNLGRLLRSISKDIPINKWLIAQHSKCGNLFDERIAEEQLRVGSAHLLGRFLGPNINALGNEFRFDGCHFNKKGQKRVARLWFDAINESERIDNLIQKETMLYYFKGLFK